MCNSRLRVIVDEVLILALPLISSEPPHHATELLLPSRSAAERLKVWRPLTYNYYALTASLPLTTNV